MQIYSVQSYRDELTIASKLDSKATEIKVSHYDDDGVIVTMLVDGHHTLDACKRTGVTPIIIEVPASHKTLVDYVTAFGDLSNPVNIETRRDLW